MKLIELIEKQDWYQNIPNLEILKMEIFGNSVFHILIAIVIMFFIMFTLEGVDFFLTQRLKSLDKQSLTGFYKALLTSLEKVTHVFYSFVGFYFAVKILDTNPEFSKLIDSIFIAFLVIQLIISGKSIVQYFVMKTFHVKEDDAANMTAINGVMLIVNIVLWVLGSLTIISNFGINITSLAASLGIGGIAIAFALQNILEDLFSSFSIYFDKPFQIGDFIVTGSHSGTITKIGLKTTRLKALQGEEIVISNKELTTSRIQNFKKLRERRVQITVGATYDTPNEKLKKIPEMVTRICDADDLIRLDRVNFFEFAASSLNFEIIIFFNTNEYNVYMNHREQFNLKLKEEFEKEGIEFAFPTQTLFIEKNLVQKAENKGD